MHPMNHALTGRDGNVSGDQAKDPEPDLFRRLSHMQPAMVFLCVLTFLIAAAYIAGSANRKREDDALLKKLADSLFMKENCSIRT